VIAEVEMKELNSCTKIEDKKGQRRTINIEAK